MISTNQRIAYVLGARFPTNKAYGVTARETLEVLINKGFELKIYCIESKYFDSDFKKLTRFIENFPKSILAVKLTNIGEKGSRRFNHLFWKFGLLISVVKGLSKIKAYNPDIIWIRDPLIASIFLLVNPYSKIILEVHEARGYIYYRLLKKYKSRIIFCPINVKNEDFILDICPRFTSLMSPMGIRKENLQTAEMCSKFVQNLKARNYKDVKIAYLGKFAPGGYSKGLEDLIDLAKLYSDNKDNFYIVLIGATQSELKIFNNLRKQLNIQPKFLKIYKHISHSQILKVITSFDVLVLPEYRSHEYNGMPIKLMEYIASGRITVVADTGLYRSFFTGKYSPFFYKSGDKYSLDRSIRIALRYKNLEEKLIAGVNFSAKFTWEHRTLKIISLF
jgi:glycosyltransferase involved in cell wall biosynthesis